MTQPEILKEILAKIAAIETELKSIKSNLDQNKGITNEQIAAIEEHVFTRLDYAI